jgi:F-type H+-transporting ATPase subunit a
MPKRAFLGYSLPLLIGILVVIVLLFSIGFASGPLGKKLLGDLGLPGWLSVPRHEPELPPTGIFHIAGFPITNTVISAWLSIVLVVGFCFLITRRMSLVPGRLQSVLETVLGWLFNFCKSVAGEEYGRRFFPIVATIFLFVASNAWLSLLPGFVSIHVTGFDISTGEIIQEAPLFRGANTDINLPLALALSSFFFVEYFGFKLVGRRYLEKFINIRPLLKSVGLMFRGKALQGLSGLFNGAISIFVGLLEALSELIRIISFTFRLFGNMTAGEILLLVATFLIPWIFALPFYGLELLVGFVQALIFAGLTLVFLTMASAPHGASTQSSLDGKT